MSWDVFIAHASEDKEDFVEELVEKLTEKGLDVWYDEFILKMGDSLRRSIDKGLAESDFGIVVLSPDFFSKEWPQKELDGLAARETTDKKVILPIWHKVSKDDVLKFSPTLAIRFAARTEEGMDKVIEHIIKVVKPELIEKDRANSLRKDTEKRLQGASPVTRQSVLKYANELSSEIKWEEHIDKIYDGIRGLNLQLVEQVKEASEDKWSNKKLTEIYNRLLEREPDPVGLLAFQPWIFTLRDRGIEIVEQSILASEEYRRKYVKHNNEKYNNKNDEIEWIGVSWEGRFLAYDGPYESLDLKENRTYEITMKKTLNAAGFKERLCNPEKVSKHSEKGYHVIYLTDKKSWRQKIINGRQILMAKIDFKKDPIGTASSLGSANSKQQDASVFISPKQKKFLHWKNEKQILTVQTKGKKLGKPANVDPTYSETHEALVVDCDEFSVTFKTTDGDYLDESLDNILIGKDTQKYRPLVTVGWGLGK